MQKLAEKRYILRVQQHRRLVNQYRDHLHFALDVSELPALIFIPVVKVIQSCKLLLKNIYYVDYEELLSPLTIYSKDS